MWMNIIYYARYARSNIIIFIQIEIVTTYSTMLSRYRTMYILWLDAVDGVYRYAHHLRLS